METQAEWDILPHFVSCLHGIYLELLENTPPIFRRVHSSLIFVVVFKTQPASEHAKRPCGFSPLPRTFGVWITHIVLAVDIVPVTSPKIRPHRNRYGRPMNVMRRECDPRQ